MSFVSTNFNTLINQYAESVRNNTNQPPKLQEVVENGVKVVKVLERGDFKFILYQSLINSATLPPVFGTSVPQLRSASTAIDQFGAILTGAMLGGLPGIPFSIGNLLTSMPSALLSQLTSGLSSELFGIVQSILNVSQSYQTGMFGGGSMSGNMINPEVFFVTAVDMLTKCSTAEDVVETMTELMTNTSLSGMSAFGDVTIDIPSPFGNSTLTLSPSGTITFSVSDAVTTALSLFSQGLPGTISNLMSVGSNLGTSIMRMSPEFQGLMKATHEKIASAPKDANITTAQTTLNTALSAVGLTGFSPRVKAAVTLASAATRILPT